MTSHPVENSHFFTFFPFSVNLIASDFFDSFMLQVRGRDPDDGNITHVGSWVDVPGIAAVLKCKGNKLAAVVDKGETKNAREIKKNILKIISCILITY